jgi:hypothetical protein
MTKRIVRCRHHNTIETSVGYCSGRALLCLDCGGLNTFVPWGPAAITPEVEIEIRAAELVADESWPHGLDCGWCAEKQGDAYYLAHCIRTHSEEKADQKEAP